MLVVPAEKIDRVQEIIDRVSSELKSEQDDEPESLCLRVEVEVSNHRVWFSHDESMDPDQQARIVQALLDELEIDEPFVFSWAYTCSRPRIDEFGGGACVVRRGHEPHWIDAQQEAEKFVQLHCKPV